MQAFTEISFPGLGISLNPSTGFSLGSLQIRWYGVIIALGLCLAVLYACRRCKEFGITEDDLIDGVLWVTPFAIVCARIYVCRRTQRRGRVRHGGTARPGGRVGHRRAVCHCRGHRRRQGRPARVVRTKKPARYEGLKGATMQNQDNNIFLLVKASIAAVCGAFTAAFGWLGWLTVAWVVCMALDWLSGSAAACKRGN